MRVPIWSRGMGDARVFPSSKSLSGVPVAIENRVHDLALPLTLDEFIFDELRLFAHPQLFQNPCRRLIPSIESADDPMHPHIRKGDLQERPGRFGRIPAALVHRIHDEAELALV